MKALSLLFTIAVLAVSACQASSPMAPQDDGRSLEQAALGMCDPRHTPC